MELIPRLRPEGKAEVIMSVIRRILKVTMTMVLLFLLMCSVMYFTSATVLLGGKQVEGVLLSKPHILENPISALVLGIFTSAILQKQQLCLSIFITMASTSVISIETAMPLIMGMNIGSSITPALLSLSFSYNRVHLGRSATAALLPHFIHWLTAAILLPLEMATGVLFQISNRLFWEDYPVFNTYQNYGLVRGVLEPLTGYMLQVKFNDSTNDSMNTQVVIDDSITYSGLFIDTGFSITVIGVLTLIVSVMLVTIFTILSSKSVSRGDNTFYSMFTPRTEDHCAYIKGFVIIFVGTVLTMVVQNGNLFQCVMLPFISIGILSTEKAYPLLVGSNIGATIAMLLDAISNPWDSAVGLQLVFCHVMFNLCGFILFYCLPYSSTVPNVLAEYVGHRAREYRWVMIVFIALIFFLLPLTTFGLALAGPNYVICFLSVLVFVILIVTTVNMLQSYCPGCLTPAMRSWDFLPSGLRSLEPYDICVSRIMNSYRSISCRRTHTILFPNESNIHDSRISAIPKDVHITVPEETASCCSKWFTPRSFYKRYILSVPPTTSTPKAVNLKTRTPVLLSFKTDNDNGFLENSYHKYDPRTALNFGTLGFDEENFSSDSESSEDPSDFTRSSSTSSYTSTSDDGQLLLFNAF